MIDTLGLEGGEETLHGGIVVAVSSAAHADLDAIGQELLVIGAGELATRVRMMQQARVQAAALPEGHMHGIITRSVFMRVSIDQPTILRENRSITAARYGQP